MIRLYKIRKSQPANQDNTPKDEDIQDSRIEQPRPKVNITIEKKSLIQNSYITRVTKCSDLRPRPKH